MKAKIILNGKEYEIELTEEQIKEIYRQQYKDYIGEDIPTKEDWGNNNLYKYVATYSFDNKKIIIFSGIDIKDESIYSKSEEKIKDFIKEIGEDNFKKYVLEVDD